MLFRSPPLLDGGSLSVHAFVFDRPEELAKGHDPSLEKAIAYLLDELKKNPPKKVILPIPPKGGAPR